MMVAEMSLLGGELAGYWSYEASSLHHGIYVPQGPQGVTIYVFL